jgi:uncharacterized pyridoxal phosphate-containing UPF0001 family protein
VSAVSAEEIAARRDHVLGRIARAAERAGRDPGAVALLAVTKTHPTEVVRQAALAGLSRFGENRVAEGTAKIAALAAEWPGLEWRLIGPLQTNGEARAVLVTESLDEWLAARLVPRRGSGACLSRGQPRRRRDQSGFRRKAEALAPRRSPIRISTSAASWRCRRRGPEARPYFKRLREIRDRLADRFGKPFPELSMGMSHDFDVAVEEGSTQVRLGTALFGPRPIP